MVKVTRVRLFACRLVVGSAALVLLNDHAWAQFDEDQPITENAAPSVDSEETESSDSLDGDLLDELLRDTLPSDAGEGQDSSIFTPRVESGPSEFETIEAIEAPGNGAERVDTPDGPVEISDRRATLRALEKVTARIQDLDVGLDETVAFKSLEITLRTCNKRPPEETPETTAFLEIVDNKPDGEAVSVFTGWMFASSPALNALEHPVYDVWVIDCKISDPVAGTGSL